MEWCTTYSTHIIWTINTTSNIFDGSLFYLGLILFIDAESYLGFTMIEDILYTDEKMNAFGGLIHNWDFYNCYVYGVIC